MWVIEKNGGKYKFSERYTDPYTEKPKIISVTLSSKSSRAWNQARKILDEKIELAIKKRSEVDVSFGELYKEWFEYYQQIVKRTSWIKVPKMMPHIKKFISDDVLIRNIDEDLVQSIIDDMYTFGDLSFNYTKQVKTTLSTMLTYAVKRKYISRNVAMEVRVMPKNEDKTKKRQRMEEKYLETDEVQKLLAYLYSKPQNQIHAYISEFLYLNGLRYGELQALQVKNNKGSYVEIHGTLDYTDVKMSEAIKTSPKNDGSWRNVELSDRSKEILDELYLTNVDRLENQNEESYYFISYTGTPLTIGSYNTVIQRAAKKLGIKKTLTSHIFRHTHVATLSELGIPLEAIMERIGHSDASTTLGIYNHVTNTMKQNLVVKLNELEKTATFLLPFEENTKK